MQPSILRSMIRAFLATFAALVGIGLGLLLITLFFISLFSEKEDELELKSHYSASVAANGENVRKKLSSNAPVILKINVTGMIGTEKMNMSSIRQQLIESREGIFKGNRVKAILLHVNTPGGTVVDSDGIYRVIKEYKDRYQVPVYAYVDGLCASGGIYVAVACDKIFASDVSLIGSIGVLSPPFFNITGLMEKVGLEAKTLFAGKGKDDMNPFRPWKSGEDENFKGLIDYYYNHFVELVVSNRQEVDRTLLVNDYGARVFSPNKAYDYGLIDGYGYSLQDTLKLLAKQVGIEDDYYQVVKLDRKFLFSDLFDGESTLMKGRVAHSVEWPGALDSALMHQFLYLYLPQ